MPKLEVISVSDNSRYVEQEGSTFVGAPAELEGAGAQSVQQSDEAEGGFRAAGGQASDLVQLRPHGLRCLAYGPCQVGCACLFHLLEVPTVSNWKRSYFSCLPSCFIARKNLLFSLLSYLDKRCIHFKS